MSNDHSLPDPDNYLIYISNCYEPVVTIKEDGTVTIHKHGAEKEAAQIFWDAIRQESQNTPLCGNCIFFIDSNPIEPDSKCTHKNKRHPHSYTRACLKWQLAGEPTQDCR